MQLPRHRNHNGSIFIARIEGLVALPKYCCAVAASAVPFANNQGNPPGCFQCKTANYNNHHEAHDRINAMIM